MRPGHPVLVDVGPGATVARLESAGEANAWLSAELPNLIAAAEAGDHGLFPLDLCRILTHPIAKRGDFHTELRLAELAIAAAEASGSDGDRTLALRGRSMAYLHLEAIDLARVDLERALEAARAEKRVDRIRAILTDLGYAAMLAGDHEAAVARLTEALDGYRAADLTVGTAVTLYNLGTVHLSRGDRGSAEQALAESLAIRRTTGDEAGRAMVLALLGHIRLVRGDRGEARSCFDEAIEVCGRLGNRLDGWFATFGRAVVRLLDGQTRAALADVHAAWRLCTPQHAHQTAATLRIMARATRRAGHPGLADGFDERADAAYAALTARVDDNVEAMLALV